MRWSLHSTGFVLFLIIAALFSSPSAATSRLDEEDLSEVYRSWCLRFEKDCAFSDSANDLRFEIFKDNYRYATNHNRQHNHSYSLGLNQFADLTNEEFKHRFFGLRPLLRSSQQAQVHVADEDVSLPARVDWREQGAVTRPKDQGQCGGCWAFSTTGAIEGINKIVTGELMSLSEQELIDCDKGDYGCNGGLMQNAFEYVIKNGGLHTEDDYPYHAAARACERKTLENQDSDVVTIDNYKMIAEGDEKALLQAVARQPVSVAIEAAGREFQLYASGVFTGPCGEDVNHGVLVVGYGSENGRDYWLVKNSWGETWGDRGFIKMQRNTGRAGGLCSINTMASYPVKKGESPPSPSPSPPSPTPPSPTPPQPKPEERCDRLHKCPAGTTCCCRFNVGPMCLSWGCCNVKSAICCSDHKHCCPHDYPVCSPGDGLCLKKPGDTSGIQISRNVSPVFDDEDVELIDDDVELMVINTGTIVDEEPSFRSSI